MQAAFFSHLLTALIGVTKHGGMHTHLIPLNWKPIYRGAENKPILVSPLICATTWPNQTV